MKPIWKAGLTSIGASFGGSARRRRRAAGSGQGLPQGLELPHVLEFDPQEPGLPATR